jgi:hypothetical protein
VRGALHHTGAIGYSSAGDAKHSKTLLSGFAAQAPGAHVLAALRGLLFIAARGITWYLLQINIAGCLFYIESFLCLFLSNCRLVCLCVVLFMLCTCAQQYITAAALSVC